MVEPNIPWYLDAVIYGIDVEKFADGNGDGIGDFIGLTEKLPYITGLGVTCIWLLPFYGSPDRDNGYDVSDFYAINPKVGTRADFLEFLHRAGEQGIRVIIDLVVNHTSNEHPWFEAARRDDKSRYRDYYVWSADPPSVAHGATSIFPGEEPKVWTYDEVARSYYFHKFYHFQPDLNIANEEVRREILRVVDYWLAFGVSGFRVDAAPLIIGDNGLEHANPRDPHGVLRELESYMQQRRSDGVLLGEVNLPAKELERYFGAGDQLGLLFNFTLACYVFAALATEKAGPVEEAIAQLPEPPSGCGWANFLRNLDELDFSRVPQDLKETVFEAFAPDKEMQVFDRGVRRRIAPMLDGDQKRIELAFSIIMSMRGSPLFVYGDEIGIGEDLSKHGRNAVRVPMQWSSRRNAGFSDAPKSKLVQAPVDEGRFSYERLNVEAQKEDGNSLLNGVKRLIGFRRKQRIIVKGRFVRLPSVDPGLLIHGYEHSGDMLLVIHNLTGKDIVADVPLQGLTKGSLYDLVSETPYGVDGSLKLTVPGYGYIWLTST
jgi:maltose alpha-D-glucosyltransferase / alpha-amylase